MRLHLQLWIIVGILFLFFVFGLFFLLSISSKQKRHQKIKKPLKEKEQREWKDAALRLETHITALRQENIDWQKKVKILERETDIYKQKIEELKEKLDRERGWKEKEAGDLDKKGKRINHLEEELARLEKRGEGEHIELITLRRENAELRQVAEADAQQVKALNSQMEKIQAQSDSFRKEILDLRAENKKLSQRHEDVQWIAKSIHLKVKEDLRKKTEEVEGLKKELKRS